MERFIIFVRRQGLLCAVVAVSLAVFLVGLGSTPLFDYDEATYADVAVKIADGTAPDPLTFWRYDSSGTLVPWFEKPPLVLWLQAGSMAIFGVSEFAARLPSALFGVGCAVFVFLIGRRLSGEVGGMAAALAFLTVPFFARWAREGRLDSAVVFFMVLALWCWLDWDRSRWRRYALWAALGLGFLAKSAVVAFVPVTIAITLLLWDRPALGRIVRSRDTYLGAALFLAIVVPWHLSAWFRYGEAFAASYFGKHLVGRAAANFFGDPRNPAHGPGFYLQFLWQFARPWIWVAALGISALVFHPWRRLLGAERLFRIAIVGLVTIVGVFSFIPSKLGPYIIPAVPFLAFLIGAYASSLWQIAVGRPAVRATVGAVFGVVVIIGFVLMARELALPAGGFLDDERAIGKALNGSSNTIYLYQWDFVESLMFYSQKGIRQVGSLEDLGDLSRVSLILPVPAAQRLAVNESNLAIVRRYTGTHLALVEFQAP